MRIAHVTDVYLPRVGGIELQVSDLAAQQRGAGHETLVVTTTPGPAAGDPPVLRLGGATSRFWLGPYRGMWPRSLRQVLAAAGVDAVHTHVSSFSPLAWAASRVAAALGLPTVVSVHSMWQEVPMFRHYVRLRGAANWPVVWAAVSSAAVGAVREALDGAPVAVLPNGIDPGDWLLPARPREDDVLTLISVMRMTRGKQPRHLLDTLLSLTASRPGRFRAVIVGDGPLLPALRRDLAAARTGTGIRLTGALDRRAIRTLLARSDVYLAPSPRESFGIAALEARSAGLPVIARAGSGVADFIQHGIEGWLVRSGEDLQTALAALLDDPGRLATVARHNRTVAPRICWQTVLDSADALYAAAARRHARQLGGQLAGSLA